MNKHHLAHYVIEFLLLIAAAGGIAIGAHAFNASIQQKRDLAAREWPSLDERTRGAIAEVLKTEARRSVRISCTADCGSLPADLGRIFDDVGWLHSATAVFGTPAGIIISPDDVDGRRIGAALKSISPEIAAALTVTTVDDAGPLIVIGRKPQH